MQNFKTQMLDNQIYILLAMLVLKFNQAFIKIILLYQLTPKLNQKILFFYQNKNTKQTFKNNFTCY